MRRPGLVSPRACLTILGLATIAALTTSRTGADGPDPSNAKLATFVRTLKFADESTPAVLETIGVSTIGFEYQIPPDKKAVFLVVATEPKGVVEPLSRKCAIQVGKDHRENRGSLRLTYIDPGKTNENYRGKVRWVFQFGGQEQDVWDVDRYKATGGRTSWDRGKSFVDLEVGKEYVLWEIKAYPEGVRRIAEDSPATFRYQIRFKFEAPDEPIDPQSSTTTEFGHYQEPN